MPQARIIIEDAMSCDQGISDVCQIWQDDQARPGQFLLRPKMIETCSHKALASNEQPLLVKVMRRDKVVSVWPMKIRREMGISVATDLTYPISQYSDVLGDPLDRHSLDEIRTILRASYNVDVILIRNVRPDSGLAAAFAPDAATVTITHEAPYIDLSNFSDFAGYEATFAPKSRRTLRQRRQKLEAVHGELTFDVLQGEAISDHIETAISWKRAWLARQGLASPVFDNGANEKALIELCNDPTSRLSVLSVRGKPAAIELGFMVGKNYAAYLGSFDPALAEFSVGQEQMLRTIAYCIDQGIDHYDLLPPSAGYKDRWSRGTAPVNVSDHCLCLSSIGVAYAMLQRHVRPRARRIAHSLPARLRMQLMRRRTIFTSLSTTAAALAID